MWIVVAFFASTILSVVALRWLPVYYTPLMFIRLAQQKSEGQPLTLHHHWVPLEEISPSLPIALSFTVGANSDMYTLLPPPPCALSSVSMRLVRLVMLEVVRFCVLVTYVFGLPQESIILPSKLTSIFCKKQLIVVEAPPPVTASNLPIFNDASGGISNSPA